MKCDLMKMMKHDKSLWVFAYGSLLWKPCFHYHRQVVGHIKGFKRRFFQGNTNLRGSTSKPGRVAILVPDKTEVTWGVAYEIRGQHHVQQALEHLYVRENSNGGYDSIQTVFFPRSCGTSSGDDSDKDDDLMMTSEPFSVLTFTATPASEQYMGPADVTTMARQVVAASGHAGPNSEYVLKTAEYIRRHIPEDQDRHLFELEQVVREIMLSLHSSVHCDSASSFRTLTAPV